MSDIFLSYDHDDKALAARFAGALAELGFDVWWDVAIRSGEAFDEVIEAALKRAKAVIVLWSPRSVVSRWVRAEATLADRRKTLLPVMVEPCERPIMFELTQTADLIHWRGAQDDPAWCAFVEDVARMVGRDTVPAPPRLTSRLGEIAAAAAAPSRRAWVQPPLPARLAAAGLATPCGREAEVAILADAWAMAAASQGQVVLLGGEPGIGKTFLASVAARAAFADGATVLFGQCDEDVRLPYRPFVDAFRHAIAHAPDELLVAYASKHRGELARLVPELHDRVASLPAPRTAETEAERYMLFEAAVGLVAAIAAEAPVVLVLDDLHLAGGSDLALLKHLVRAAPAQPLLIIGTFRDSDIDAGHPLTLLLADLRRESHVRRCALTGIDETAITAMLTEVQGHFLGEGCTALARALARETAGNPFFIGELVRHLADTGAISRRDDGWDYAGDPSRVGLPDSVREVIGRRIGQLASAHATIIGWAAVIGREFDLGLLEACEIGAGDPLDALDAACAAGLVLELPDERDRFRFNHALVRTTLYDGISGSRRRRMHRRIAEVLGALPEAEQDARIDELARHWLAGADGTDIDRAIDYACRAGARAGEGLAYETAAGHYAAALAALRPSGRDGDIRRCDLLLELGTMQRNAGDPAFRATMGEAAALARLLADANRLARAALGSGHPGGLQWGNAVDADLVALYREALAALGDGDSPQKVLLTGQLATELRFGREREERHQLTDEAVAMARRLGNPATLARALSARIFAIDDATTLAERLAATAELESLAETLDNAELACLAASHRFDALLEAGDVEQAAAAIVRCEASAAQLRAPFFLLVPRLLHTMWVLMRGEADAEMQVMATFQEASAIGLPHAGNIFGGQMFELRTRQGRLAEMIDAARAAVAGFPEIAAMRAGLAFALAETGAHAEAQALLDSFADDDLPMDNAWSTAAFLLVETAAILGDRRIAAMLDGTVTPLAGQLCTAAGVRCDGSFAHAAGQIALLLGHTAAARDHFAAAIATNDRVGARPAAVRSRRVLAGLLLDRGETAAARALAAEALATARDLGMEAETARLQALAGTASDIAAE